LARGYVGETADGAPGFAVLPGIGRAYRTGDLARQDSDGGLRILGRVDRQVNLHGHRIELVQIEQALVAHREVKQALVLPDVDGLRASRLIAWVVVSEAGGAALSGETLRGFLAARLPAHLIPSRFNLVDRILLTPNGKVDARAMRALQPAEMPGERRPAITDATQLRLCVIFSEVLRVEQVSAQDDFFALGGHSLLAVRLAGRIFREFGKRLPLAVFFTHRTVEALAEVLRESGDPAERGSILVPIRRSGDGAPIVLFPGAGGSILYFEALAVALGGVAPIWGAQGSRGDIATMALRYHEAILDRLGPRPCHLIGHSFGALVAFELARLREAHGHPTGSLWVLDNPAPRAASEEQCRHWSLPDWYAHIARRIARLYDVPLALDRDALEGKTDSEQAELFAGYLVEAGALPRGTPREQLDDFVVTYRENVIAGERYAAPFAPLCMPIQLVKARDRDGLLASEDAREDLLSGWMSCSAHPIRSFEVPGTHITMLLRPHADHLAECIRSLIAASSESAEMDHEVLSR
jgi:thioesterase domain-containing protein/acyl carrier protein